MNDHPALEAWARFYLEAYGMSYSKTRPYSMDEELQNAFLHGYNAAIDQMAAERNKKEARHAKSGN